MANSFYNVSGTPATGSSGSSSAMRSEFTAVQTGFGLFPTLASTSNMVWTTNAGGTGVTAQYALSAFVGGRLNDADAPTFRSGIGVAIAAKGSILVGTGANNIAQQTVGTDTQILTADSTQTNGVKWAAAPSAYLAWTTKTTNYTANASDAVKADTSGGGWTLTLPAAPTDGSEVHFVDLKGTFNTNNLTVGRNGKTIMGKAEDMTVSTQNAAGSLVYDSGAGDWRLW